MTQPRVLTFNFHEPYLCLMAKTGIPLDVGIYEEGPLARPWHTLYRPPPPNLNLLPERAWRAALDAGKYDVVIAQNENNALDILSASGAKILLCHNRRDFLITTVTVERGDPTALFSQLLHRLRESFQFVYISASKRDSYGIPGRVIPPGMDLADWGGYHGTEATVLRVGNTMRGRNLMFDVDFQEEVCAGLPCRVVGTNPGIAGAAPAPSFEALLAHYRGKRCLLHVSRKEYEDGYNLAMLEAMACGMPVVALANPTSPITDGVDGFTSYSPLVLRRRLRQLLDDPGLAREMGARGRETVARLFPMEAFAEGWRRAILDAAEGRVPKESHAPVSESGRPRLLMHFITSPMTTGRYMEEGAQPQCDVLTAGYRLDEAVLRLWGLPEPIPAYRGQQVPQEFEAPYADLLRALPRGFDDAHYLWVDCGQHDLPEDLDCLPFPKALYLIDTHVALEPRLEMARRFDTVFLAQKGQLRAFQDAGIENVSWVPLGCSPALHDVGEQERTLDVAYVGSFSTEEGDRRGNLLRRIGEGFPNHFIGRAWPEEMARIYGRARIVVNACHNRDVNMRVFEALASGALLITDEAEGLEELFEDGKHLVIYRDDEEVFGLIDRYLADDAARTRIARAGRDRVLREHTYTHRIETMTRLMAETKVKRAGAGQLKKQNYYQCERRELIPFVPLRTQRLLDVGCGEGVLARTLKKERGIAFVAGLEYVAEACARAAGVLDRVIHGDLETMDLPFEDGYFDCIICADVLEHLEDPTAALRKLGRVLAPEGVIVISIPNVQYHEVIAMLASGAWTYMDKGIMDSTHLRFFTREACVRLVEEADLELADIRPLSMRDPSHCPRDEDGTLRLGKVTIRDVSDREYEGFLTYQYVVQACRKGVDRLAGARRALAANENELAYALAVDAVGVDDYEQRRIIARSLARLGQLEKAEQHYRYLLDLREDPHVMGEYGILLVGMNRTGEARPLLEKAIEADPEYGRARGALGLVYCLENRAEEAYICLESALRSSFEHTSLLTHFMGAARETGRVAEAAALVGDFAEFYPGNFDIACQHAALLMDAGKTKQARERLDLVLMLNPEHEQARALLARLTPPE